MGKKSSGNNSKFGIQRWWLYYYGEVSNNMRQAKRFVSKSNRRHAKSQIEKGIIEYEENKDI